MVAAHTLLQAVRVAEVLSLRDRESALSSVRWTPPQMAYLRAGGPKPVLLRAGNQWLGKSYVGIADTIWRCLGTHPFDPRGQMREAQTAIVLSPTTKHSRQLQEKCWELVPKHLLHPNTSYDEGNGFRGRHGMCRFANGSKILFLTAGMGPLALSGITADHVQIDELCPPRVYEELKKRVARRNGTIRLTLTPINAPAEWVMAKVETGEIVDLHFRCEARWCIPEGYTEPLRDRTGRPMDETWIAAFIESCDEHERDVVAHGEWLVEHRDRELAGWSERYLLRDDYFRKNGVPSLVEFGVGFDWGEASGRTVAEFIGWAPESGVWGLAEWCGDGKTPLMEQARGVRRAIESMGLRMSQVKRWVGDINNGASVGYVGSMNDGMTEAIRKAAAEVGDSMPRIFKIERPNKRRGTVEWRLRSLNEQLSEDRVRVHEGCNRLLTSMRTYTKGTRASLVLKDPLDAFGYIAETYWRKDAPRMSAIPIHRR